MQWSDMTEHKIASGAGISSVRLVRQLSGGAALGCQAFENARSRRGAPACCASISDLLGGRADQNVLLFAERQLDDAICGDFAAADHLAFVADRLIVDAHGATLDVTAGFTI